MTEISRNALAVGMVVEVHWLSPHGTTGATTGAVTYVEPRFVQFADGSTITKELITTVELISAPTVQTWELDTLALIDFTYPYGFTFKNRPAIRRGSGWELLDSPERLPIPDHQVHHVAVQKLGPAGAVVLPETDQLIGGKSPWSATDLRYRADELRKDGWPSASTILSALADAVDAAAES